mmetsp:Transcript_34759/g.25914  ORF Transcript_34759/g.25914 Transcript_34759/m.25914 type:complete len:141 (+) Transcript_34759:44-466(+)
MEAPALGRQGSTVPVSLHQVESTVLPVPIGQAWDIFKTFELHKVIPAKIKSTHFETGGPGQIDSVIKVDYTDGAHWLIRINEISELRHSVGYEVLSTEPSHQATSIQGVIHLHNVTSLKHTYVEWQTDFSNDADAQVIAD